nr:MAG TPA: hypothetical protein [Caudoviricetes sp.]
MVFINGCITDYTLTLSQAFSKIYQENVENGER